MKDSAPAGWSGELIASDVVACRLAKARLPEGMAGMARLHAMIAERIGPASDEKVEVLVGIETDRGAVGAGGWRRPGTRCLRSTRCRPLTSCSASNMAGTLDRRSHNAMIRYAERLT